MGSISRSSRRLLKAKVYFLADSGRIKIGTTTNCSQRFKSLNGYHAERLALIGTIDGGQPLERAIHRHLATYRMRGEWFRDCAEVREVIKRLILCGPSAIGFKRDIYLRPIVVEVSKSPPLPRETRIKIFRMFIEMMFPDNPVAGLAEHCHTSLYEAQAWFDGTRQTPFWMTAVLTVELMKIQDEDRRNRE